MYTDLVGYTALAQSDESLALDVLKKHREVMRPILQKHGGTEVKTMGDAFLVEFRSALEAVECAVEMQTVNRASGADDRESKVSLRIGIHVGDVVHEGGDIY